MPWTDWQFWIVTLACLGGLTLIVRQIIPRKQQGCGGCVPKGAKAKVELTLEKRRL